MGWRDRRPQPQTVNAAVMRRLEAAEARLMSLEKTQPISAQLIDIDNYEDNPDNINIGELNVNWPGVHREARSYDPAVYFHDGKWRALGSNAAVYEIKVFEDDEANTVKDRAFVWEIPEDLDGGKIVKAGAFITTPGGAVEVDITVDGGGSILDDLITIPAGALSSKDGNTPQADFDVEWGGPQLSINVLAASGAGLGVWVVVIGAGVGGVLLQGFKGDPGQIGNPRGTYSGTATYAPGDTVFASGTTYVAITGSTGVTPGVTPGWEAFWMPLLEQTAAGGVGINIISPYALLPGVKGSKKMPFDGIIESMELRANAAGSLVVDIWKMTYADWPGSSAFSITGGNPPTLSAAAKTQDTVLTGWTTTFSEDDILVFNVVSATLISIAALDLKVVRA